MKFRPRDIPTRLATGVYIAHSGYTKWGADANQAASLHGMAAGAYPALKDVPPAAFVRTLSIAEMGVGAAVAAVPFVRNRVAGLLLAGFSGGLVGMYLRTPSLHRPGSVWPTPQGIGVSKDVWMLAIGLGLLVDL